MGAAIQSVPNLPDSYVVIIKYIFLLVLVIIIGLFQLLFLKKKTYRH